MFFLPTEVTKKRGIYVLTQKNFDEFLHDKEYVLVDFYFGYQLPGLVPLKEEFAKAAQILAKKGTPIKLAEVDCDVEEVLASKYDIEWEKFTSTVKIFKRDPETFNFDVFTYIGKFKAGDIISWVEKIIRGELEGCDNRGIKKTTHDLSFFLGFLHWAIFLR